MKNNNMKPQYEVIYVMFNEDAIFENYEAAKAYAKEFGGKVFVVCPKTPVKN